MLTLQNTTQQPALTYAAEPRAARAAVQRVDQRAAITAARTTRKAIVARLAQLRARTREAPRLSRPTRRTCSTTRWRRRPQTALKLMTDLVPAATAKARGEAAEMQKLIDEENGGFKLAPWDWQYYSEKVRKAEYDLDETQVRPYFELDRVLQDGVFFAANKLYGLTFKERKDIPVYQPDVRVFEVFDADGKPLALFYADYFARRTRAAAPGRQLRRPVAACSARSRSSTTSSNFTKPAPGQPALLTLRRRHDDVPRVRPRAARHVLEREVPDARRHERAARLRRVPVAVQRALGARAEGVRELREALQDRRADAAGAGRQDQKSRTFNQGYATTEYLAAALLDMAWHTLPPDAPLQDVDAFEPQALKRFNIDLPQVPPRYHTTYFSHIWGGGYSAGYYAYLWSEVIDDDAYYWFKENGGMTRANGQRFRDMILSRGGTEDAARCTARSAAAIHRRAAAAAARPDRKAVRHVTWPGHTVMPCD